MNLNRWLEWTPRGDSLDPLVARWHAICALWHGLWQDRTWLLGAGPHATARYLGRWGARTGQSLPSGHAFNEPLQCWYEYGLCGLLAMATLVVAVAPHLRPHDPWSAAWVVGVILSGTHFSVRLPMTGLVWLGITVKLLGTP
jgi:hypothetical protein